MHFPLFLPPKRRAAVLRTLKYKQSTLLLFAVSLSFCLRHRGLVFTLFIKRLLFTVWCVFPVSFCLGSPILL